MLEAPPPPPPPTGFAASGFLVEAQLSGSAAMAGNEASGTGFSMLPSLRLGASLRPLAVAANVSYWSIANLSGSYNGTHKLTIGPDIMPYIWQSFAGRARLYLLFGANLGATFVTDRSADFTGGFSVGLGGRYFLHRNFALGMEVGSRTQFTHQSPAPIGRGSDVIAVSSLYAALSFAFVAGR